MVYDLNVHPKEGDVEEYVEFAKKMNWEGLVITHTFEDSKKFNEMADKIETLREIRPDIDLVFGVEIDTDNVSEMRKIVNKIRDRSEIITVKGGDYPVNRAACENSKVDILMDPDLNRSDIGLDEYCMKRANENNVIIAYSFRKLEEIYKKPRSHRFDHISTIIKVSEKTRTRVTMVSNAYSKWQLRSPRELASILNILGMELGKAIDMTTELPKRAVKRNRKKSDSDYVAEGVEVLEDE